jgi:hypothetical protein
MKVLNLTKEQLQNDYTGRHGFAFLSKTPCDLSYATAVGSVPQEFGYTRKGLMPEFVASLSSQEFFFVYPENTSFDMPTFLKICEGYSQITQHAFTITSLALWARISKLKDSKVS